MKTFAEFESEIKSKFPIDENTLSTVLGGVVVIILSVGMYKFIPSYKDRPKIDDQAAQTTNEIALNTEADWFEKIPATYTILEGEDLSTISEKVYGFQNLWTEIARENNISNPNSIFKGQVLNIPKSDVIKTVLEQLRATSTPQITQTGLEKIEGDQYTVRQGDSLLDISRRAYGDESHWGKIAQANGILSIDLISVGQVLRIPRD